MSGNPKFSQLPGWGNSARRLTKDEKQLGMLVAGVTPAEKKTGTSARKARTRKALLDLSSRSLGRRLESPLFQQGVTKGGFRACVYAGVGSEVGSATEMIFLGIDMLRFLRISPRLSEIFVR
jgi:hypothetical protein